MLQDAVTHLRSIVDPVKLLEYYNAKYISQHGNTIRCCCPIHKGDNITAFKYDTDNGLWFCHTRCNIGGDCYDLVMQIEHVNFIEAVHRIAEIFNVNISDMTIQLRTEQTLQDTRKWIEKMRGIMDLNTLVVSPKQFDISILGDLYSIKSYRQFNSETLNHFNVKYCKQNQRIVVPIYVQETLVGVTMRRTKHHPAKWIHQPMGLRTGNYLYNSNAINNTTPLIICEGVFDVFNYWQCGFENVVATFGCHITSAQERLILLSSHNIILSYDNDIAGIKGTKQAIEALQNKTNISIANIPNGIDPGAMTFEQIHYAINNAYKIYEWRELNG